MCCWIVSWKVQDKIEIVEKHLLDSTLTTFSFFSSLEECGRYLETVKVYENKPADIIREQMDTDYLSRVSIFFFFDEHGYLFLGTIPIKH